MQLKRIAVNVFIATISFVVSAVVIGGVAIPYVIVQQFSADMRHVASGLEKDFVALENTTYLSVIDEPTVAIDQKQRDITAIQRQTDATLRQITVLEEAARRLDTWMFPDVAGFYDDARIVGAKSATIVSQTRLAVQEYRDLIAFLEFYNRIVDDVRAQNDSFNAITDFNQYAGQGDRFRTIAASLRGHVAALNARIPPHELEPSVARLVLLLETTAKGYDSLATGFDIAIDKNIYDAVAIIESNGRELETSESDVYITSLQNSRIIKDIRQLEQKLDPLTSTN